MFSFHFDDIKKPPSVSQSCVLASQHTRHIQTPLLPHSLLPEIKCMDRLGISSSRKVKTVRAFMLISKTVLAFSPLSAANKILAVLTPTRETESGCFARCSQQQSALSYPPQDPYPHRKPGDVPGIHPDYHRLQVTYQVQLWASHPPPARTLHQNIVILDALENTHTHK